MSPGSDPFNADLAEETLHVSSLDPGREDPATTEARSALDSYRADSRRRATQLRRTAEGYLTRGREDLYEMLMLGIEIEHLPSYLVRRLRNRMPIGTSFAAAMATTNGFVRAVKETDIAPYLAIVSKSVGRDLASRLGMRSATLHQTNVALDEVRFRPGTVVKPTDSSGARGVLLCSVDGSLKTVRDGQSYDDPDGYIQAMRGGLSTGEIRKDRWQVEELLVGPDGGPAEDLKFYAFYGSIPLTLHCRRLPRARFCFYSDGEIVKTGKYEDRSFPGPGVPAGWHRTVQDISLRLPLPFVRIDVYNTADGLYFGEFTTVPGKYQKFNTHYDRLLGEEHVQAQARIFRDFLRGTSFTEFESLFGAGSAAGP